MELIARRTALDTLLNGTGAAVAVALTPLAGGVDPSFANQGEAEGKYRSVEAWGVGGIYHSESQVNGTMQRIRSTDTEAAHRARLNDDYLRLSRRGLALDRR
jgi:hypothetical protein